MAFLGLICPPCSGRCSQPIVFIVFKLVSALAGQIWQSYSKGRRYLFGLSQVDITAIINLLVSELQSSENDLLKGASLAGIHVGT